MLDEDHDSSMEDPVPDGAMDQTKIVKISTFAVIENRECYILMHGEEFDRIKLKRWYECHEDE